MSNATTYTTRDEAINWEIVEVINAGEADAAEFDIEAIADEVLDYYDEGYACKVSEDEYWEIVFRHFIVDRLNEYEDTHDTAAIEGPTVHNIWGDVIREYDLDEEFTEKADPNGRSDVFVLLNGGVFRRGEDGRWVYEGLWDEVAAENEWIDDED